ncbi:MAG: hypothetical protein ABIG32_00735 [Candidatus Uhrbacteria bacterium]|nr:hypothetical protein [Patescibacteria group bacterium]MBU1906728.1 hypothetical protein [Patescibacteria group bacterium]
MIAEIYLIKRLPRRFTVFDYTIPDNMSVRRGSLVLVPFRNLQLRAVVAGIKETSGQKDLRDLGDVKDLIFLSDAELAVYETLAEQVVQSVSAVLDAAFPPARKRSSSIKHEPIAPITNKIRSGEIKYIKQALELISSGGHHFIETTDLAQATAIIQSQLVGVQNRTRTSSVRIESQQTLVLAPNTHDADLIASALSKFQPTILDSRSTLPQRSDIAAAWRDGSVKLLISTRIGSLIPAQNLGAIFVVRSGVDEHAQYDRNPRYDAREAAYLAHQATGAALIMFGPIPRIIELKRFESRLTLPQELKPKTELIDLKTESQRSELAVLNEKIIERIGTALQNGQKVLLSYNLKDAQLSKTGLGNRELQKQLQKKFPDIKIARIEKGSEPVGEADIILATQHYFEMQVNPFAMQNVGLIVELAADIGLSEPFYTATENTLQKLLELQGLAWRAACPIIIQTWAPELIKQMLDDPHATLTAEADVRQHFIYPPFGTLWRIRYRGEGARGKLDQLESELDAPEIKLNRTEKALEVRVRKESTNDINNILKKLDDSYIIEVNPERNL